MDFLEALMLWHLGNSTSTQLVMKEVQDAIVAEVTSFPVDKVAVGESPSVAMHVPVPLLRASPSEGPCSVAELGQTSVELLERGGGGSVGSGSGSKASVGDEAGCHYGSESLIDMFPEWRGWTQPSVALTLRAVLMTASALTAAAGMQQPMIGIEKGGGGDTGGGGGSGGGSEHGTSIRTRNSPSQEKPSRRRKAPQILLPETLLPASDLGNLRAFFETLWPDSPYSFGTYSRDSVSSDMSYLINDAGGKGDKNGRRKKGERRLVIVVNVSTPGNEDATESDGEGMVNAAETLLELNVPFVVLTLWQDNALARSVATGTPRREERQKLRVNMERRTRILLGRSVKRRDARDKVRAAYARAKREPQGSGYVALEEALAEARYIGADAGEGEAMLEEIRQEARAAEEAALAAALQAACLQVPVDVAGLRANLQRARGLLEREDRAMSAMTLETGTEVEDGVGSNAGGGGGDDAGTSETPLINMVYNDSNWLDEWDETRTAEAAAAWNASAARADKLLSADSMDELDSMGSMDSMDEGEEGEEDGGEGGERGLARAGSVLGSMEDIDRFRSGGDDNVYAGAVGTSSSALRAAVVAAEAALEAVELEADLRVTLQDEASLNVASVPKLEELMLRAAKVADRKPPLTQEGAAKLNTLVSRCFSRATALQEMDGARAALAEALEPSLRGRDLSPGGLEPEAIPTLEKAIARARSSAWPWQLEESVAGAEKVLERWRALRMVESAMASRSALRLRAALAESRKSHPSLDTREVEKLLSELDAERALEGGDQRLKAYFNASKVAWESGKPTREAAAMLATLRASLDITDAEHEQVTRAASAGSRTPEEAAAAEAASLSGREVVGMPRGPLSFGGDGQVEDAGALAGGPGNRVRFAARAGKGIRGPLFEGYTDDAEEDPELQLYVLNWDDPEVELYVGGAGPRDGFRGLAVAEGRNAQMSTLADDDIDEATAAWAEAVADEGSAGEEVTVVSGGGSGDGGASLVSKGGARWRRVGDTIIYNEEEIIGVGSSGTYVFRGYVQHTTRARHAVAVKRIARPPGEEGRELLKLVEREVELLTALNQSPRVPFFHCWGITSSHVFIALELCTESLREHVTRQGAGMTVSRRMDILSSVAAGIAWLHDPGKTSGCITHNDLKPENLLVDSTGNVKIADVGLGVQLKVDRGDEYTMSTFRKYGIDIVLAGRAPEMLQHRPLTPAADIWAMGVVFYFVLTGRASPFSESGRDVPTDADIINGRHHLQNLMTVGGLQPRRALEARHLLASMLAPDPEQRPDAAGVLSHPLFWDDEEAMRHLVALHSRSASCQTEMGTTLSNVATDALLSGGSGGNSERGALLAAASMDLTDWQRLVDKTIVTRITKHLVHEGARKGKKSSGNGGGGGEGDSGGRGGGSKADVGRKPYGNGFADLLRFCRNAYEHPPTGDEIEPMVMALVEASVAMEASAQAAKAAAAAEAADVKKQMKGRARLRGSRLEGNAESESVGDGDDIMNAKATMVQSANAGDASSSADDGGGGMGGGRDARRHALLPRGVVPGMAYRKLSRRQRRAVLASYLMHLFPGLPLAVHECALAVGPDDVTEEGAGGRSKRGGGFGGPRGKSVKGSNPASAKQSR